MTFIEDLKKPINYISLLIGIAAFISGFFFYYNSKKSKAISYNIDQPSSLIYDSKNSSSAIKVLEKDSVPIKDNVYILTGIIWNSGNMPITIEDVRQSLSLNLMGAKKILDFKIVSQTDPSIALFKLSKNKPTSLALSWKYFDPGYAFKFQIIYTGYENARFNLKGKILDVGEFNEVAASKNKKFSIYTVIAFSFFLLVSIYMIILRAKKNQRIHFYMILEIVIYIAIITYFLLDFSNSAIPLN